MKIGLLLPMLAAGALLCGCKQTTVTHAITVKVAPDGARTVTDKKSVTQYVGGSENRTGSTKAILDNDFSQK